MVARGVEWAPSGGYPREEDLADGMPEPFLLDAGIANPVPDLQVASVQTSVPMLWSLSILLPALNEEHGVAAVMNRIPRQHLEAQGIASTVWLLDGRSTDRTRTVAHKLGAEIFVQKGRGKGAAFRQFVPKIREGFTLFLDSDGTYPPELIPHFVEQLQAGSRVVLGSRLRGSIEEGAMSHTNYLGNRILSRLAAILFRTPVSDVCSGMWGFESELLKSFDLTADGFELEAEIFAECALRGIPITELPIPYQRRIGEPKLQVREGIRIALALLKKRLAAGSARHGDSSPRVSSASRTAE